MPEGQTYNWGNTLGTIATMATGNAYIGMVVNYGFNWTRQDKGNNDNNVSYNTGKLANNVVTAYAASKSAKKRAQATQNAGKLDLGYLRAEAEKNGFNPLTVLRATGGQGSTTSADVGKMASAQFWQTFAQGMPNTYETSYDRQMKQATLANTIASTKSMLGSLNERGRDDVPLLVTAYDPTGKLADFLIPNPEVLEFSFSEFSASLTAIAASFASQNNITKAEAKDILMSIYQNRKSNISKKKPILEANPDMDMPNFAERVRRNYAKRGKVFNFEHMAK